MDISFKRRSVKKILAAAAIIIAVAAAIAEGAVIHWTAQSPASPSYDADMPILMYHDLNDGSQQCNSMTVTAARMEADLKWLSDNGYTTVLPRELAAGEPLPDKPVMITFDDGYRSNYEILYPLLKKYNMKASISLVVANTDNGCDKNLTWDMCREMIGSGLVEIDSHTYDLHNPDTCGAYKNEGDNGIQRHRWEGPRSYKTRVLDDIKKSYDRIKAETGQAPSMLAYPYGISDRAALLYVHRYFPVTVVTAYKTADLRHGLHELTRFSINMDQTPEQALNIYQI